MTYLHLTLALCKGEGQGHAYFDSKYLGNDDTLENKHYYCHQIGSNVLAFD